MPERSDKWVDLVPHHRRPKTDAEEAFEEYISKNGIPTAMEAFAAGWEAHQSRTDKMYSIEEIKQILN